MSSLRRHFHHFGLKQQQGHQQQPQSATVTNCLSNQQQQQQQHQQQTSFPVIKGNRGGTEQTNLLIESMASSQRDVKALDTVTFKEDIFNCLDMCSSYIQALNTLCSTGAVLAQNLTQVFSRDLVEIGKPFHSREVTSGHGKPSSGRLHPFGFLAPKSSSSSHAFNGRSSSKSTATSRSAVAAAAASDIDSTYYEVAEQFLRMWEMMSVSTAGASATIKTETLMSLQEVINKLESAPDPRFDTFDNGSSDPSLEQCIQAAKSCLLSYIELQTQFSYNSWKSLSQLSKVLKSDANMADVVKNIKQHFSFSDHHNQENCGKSDSTSEASHFDGGMSSSSCPKSAPGPANFFGARSGVQNSTSTITTDATEPASSFGLQDAITLLSLGDSKRTKKQKRRQRKKSNGSLMLPNYSTHPGPNSSEKSATLDGRYFDPSLRSDDESYLAHKRQQQEELNIIKQSTWPGKATSAATNSHTNNADRNSFNDWSLWSDSPNAGAFQSHSVQRAVGGGDPFSSENFQAAWNAFAISDQSSATPVSNCSVSASASGSMSGGSNNSVGLVSSSSVKYGDVRAGQQGQGQPPQSACNVNNLDLFDSLDNFVDRASFVVSPAKRLSCRSSEGLTFDHPGLDFASFAFNNGGCASRNSGSGDLIPMDVRMAKTSTWPMKQVSHAISAANHSGANNWAAFSPIPFPTLRVDESCGFEASSPANAVNVQQQQRSLISNSSLWPFDDEGPKMQSQQQDFSRLFEPNNNNGMMNKNY